VHEAIMDHSAQNSPSAIVTAAGTAMDMASSVTDASVRAGEGAVQAAGASGRALADLDMPSAVSSAVEMTTSTGVAATGVIAGAGLAAGSMALTGFSLAITALANMHDLAQDVTAHAGSTVLDAGRSKAVKGEASIDRKRSKEQGQSAVLKEAAAPDILLPSEQAGSSSSSTCGCGCLQGLTAWSRRLQNSSSQRTARDESITLLTGKEAEVNIGISDLLTDLPDSEEEARDLSSVNHEILKRHVDASPWHPGVILYDAAPDPPPKLDTDRQQRRAYRIPMNSQKPVRLENENFEGSFCFLHRTPEDCSTAETVDNPYQWHFEKKTRRWEARVQGRFKQAPNGSLYVGCVLEDFDYSDEPTWAATAFAGAVVPLMEMVVGESFYFAWGSRGDAAHEPDGEFSTVMTNFSGFDQVIVTRPDEEIPSLETEITGLGFCRNVMSSSDYRQAVKDAISNIDTRNTYTFCVWGSSKYIDVANSQILTPVKTFDYSGFLGEWPAHFLIYSLRDDETDPRHLERKKIQYVDIMVWSSDMEVDTLAHRYEFLDDRYS